MGIRILWLVLAAALLTLPAAALADTSEKLTDAREVEPSACSGSECGSISPVYEPDEFNAIIVHSRERIVFAFAGLGLLAFGLFYFGRPKNDT